MKRACAVGACLWLMPMSLPASQNQAAIEAPSTINVGERLPRWDRIRPGTNRYLRYRVENGRRIAMDIWSRTIAFEPDPSSGETRLHITQEWNGATLPMERNVDSWFEMETFRPISHRTRRSANGRDSAAGFLFGREAVTGDPSVPGNSAGSLSMPTVPGTFNFETDLELLAALPWREGYAVRINFYHPGGEPPAWYVYRVSGSDMLDFGGRAIPCWVVAIDYGALGDARFWIDKETQRVIKVATRGPDIQGTLYKLLLPSE